MGSYEVLFLYMQLYLTSYLKLVWNPMLIMALLILGIGFLQNNMNLLSDILYPFNKFGFFINLGLSMRGFFPCRCNEQSYVNWGQIIELQEHLKRVMANRDMKGSFITKLNIRKDIIPCVDV